MTLHTRIEAEKPIVAASPQLLIAREELASLGEPIWSCQAAGFKFHVHCQGESLWTIIEWPEGGAVAARPAYAPGGKCRLTNVTKEATTLRLSIKSLVGVYHVRIEVPAPNQPLLHWRTSLAPTENLTIAGWPADLYPLDLAHEPLAVAGTVHASQKGPTGAILYATVTRPWQGSLLYAQDLTALSPFFESTKTSAKDRITDRWPELGFLLPHTPEKPLLAGEDTVISDAYLLLSPDAPDDKVAASRVFLDMYAQVYLAMPHPAPVFRDWPRLVDETVRDLTHSTACGENINGHRYMLAYVGSDDRPPESMVQLALLLPMIEYSKWLGQPIPLADQLRANLATFYNPTVKTIVRWLPGDKRLRGKEEHMSEEVMDSWYLYHTYLNLSRLALDGDEFARDLFLESIEFGIRVARHFSYHWPVFYNLYTLDVIKAQTQPGMGGEHDVGAQYAHVMLQAWDLTGERRYLDEAERSAQALQGLGFDLGYQFNNTAFGAGGLLRLWKETGNELYRDLSYVCLANVVRNFWLWECDFGHAKNYHTYLGLVPLRDAVYIALYEELEVLAAFHEYLRVGGDDLPDSIRVLLCEYCKYVIDRAWYHYPAELPPDSIADKPHSGHINRDLAIPLEDIYEGWEKAGQVGQEVYGAAAPFVFATRHCHRIEGVTFRIHCEYPIDKYTIKPRRGQRIATTGAVQFRLIGNRHCHCHVRIVPDDYIPLPQVELKYRRGRAWHKVAGVTVENGYLEFELPGDAEVAVAWKAKTRRPSSRHVEGNGVLSPNGSPKKKTRRAASRR